MQQRKEGLNHNMPYFVFMFVCCVREKGVVVGIEILLWEGQSTSFGNRCLPFDLFLHSILTKMNP